MKKLVSVLLSIVMVIGCFSIAGVAVEKTEAKVEVSVSSNGAECLIGEVFADYSAKVTVPKGAVINAGEVTGKISMTDISSLGIEGTRTYEKSITTGVEKEVLLDNYLPDFTNATVSGTIDGKAYTYSVVGTDSAESYVIEAIPENEDDARAAYQAAASHITASTKAADDSYAIIPGTAYIQIGAEKLSMENTDEELKLDNIVQGSGIKAEIKSAVKLEEVEELEDAQVEVYIPAGSVLAVGQSVVTLNDNATIKMYGYKDSDDVNTILSMLRDCQTNEEIIKTAVLFVSDFANAIEGKDLVVNVEFEKAEGAFEGTIESFNGEDATVELIVNGEIVQSVTVSGNGVQNCGFESLPYGTYTVKVSKENHVPREYEIEVNGEDVSAEFKINLIGDINGDGKVNTVDVAMANAHAKKVSVLTGYQLECANVTGDGVVNTVDVARINAHARRTSLLW